MTTSTKVDRDRLFDEAREVAGSYPADAPLRHTLADHLDDALHEAFPFLTVLRNRAGASLELDIQRYRTEHPDPDDEFGLDVPREAAETQETQLARKAYEAALRAVIFGYRL